MSRGRREELQWDTGKLGVDLYDPYINYSDGFMGIFVLQKVPNCTL